MGCPKGPHLAIQPISTAFGDPLRQDFSLPDRGRCPRDAPKPAASAGTGVAPKDANQREREADVDLSAANGLQVCEVRTLLTCVVTVA